MHAAPLSVTTASLFQWHGGRSLLGDVGGHRWHRACSSSSGAAAQWTDVEPCHWGHQRDAHGSGYVQLYGSGDGFGHSGCHDQQGAEHYCAATPTTVTIWPSAAMPGLVDSGAQLRGAWRKFRADVEGTITGIRFYKANTNTGTHVGNLWSSTGTRLATVTFTGETLRAGSR